MSIDAPETEEVTKSRFYCDGGVGGHPRVWLQIDPETSSVQCPYCDKLFILKGGSDAH